MRILFIVLNQTYRGTFWRAFFLGRGLAQLGHIVTLLSVSPKARYHLHEREVDGVHLVETPDLLPGPLRSGWDPWNIHRRCMWIKGKQFDIVHSFESRPVVIYPALLAKRQGARLIMDWCDWFGKGGSIEERPDPLMRAVLRPVETYFENHFRTRADGTTVINTFLRDRAISRGVDPNTILLLHNGSETVDLPSDTTCIRQKLKLPENGPLIGFVGGTYFGDAQFMAASFNELLILNPGAQLILVGTFNRNIEQWVKKPSAIIRTGKIDTHLIYPYLAACDLCWLPLQDSGANRGRLPLKLNDYLSAGKPVIATAVGDIESIINEYEFGIITRPDPLDFAQATQSLLENAARLKLMSQSALKTAAEVFNWDLLSGRLEEFYKKVIAS